MVAELICVGSELLKGNAGNSNMRFLAQQCALLGLDIYCQVTVGDDYKRLKAVIGTALDRSDLILLSGGPGPAEDGLIKEACAEAMGVGPREAMGMERREPMALDRHDGMAPGFILEREGKAAILLPGHPEKLRSMFKEQIFPWLLKRRQPAHATDGKAGLEMAVVELLKQRGLTMSTAESCTGGMVAARLVNVSGVSQVFMGGVVTYSNEAKTRLLGVTEETLKAYGAVSGQTAAEMAAGGAALGRTDVCVAITGLAGPEGGTDKKPVGLVYMACCLKGKITVKEYHFKGDRDRIREQSTAKALDLVRLCILGRA